MKKNLIPFLLGFFSLAGIGALILSLTTLGLPAALRLVSLLIPGELAITGYEGRFIDKIHADNIDYRNEMIHVSLNDVSLEWRGIRVLLGSFDIQQLAIGALQIERLSTTDQAFTLPNLETIKSGFFSVLIDKLQIDHISFNLTELQLTHVQATLALNEQGLRLRQVEVRHPQGTLLLQANLGDQFNPPIKLMAQEYFSPDGVNAITGETRLEGNLSQLQGTQIFTEGLDASLQLQADNLGPAFTLKAQGQSNIASLSDFDRHLTGEMHIDLDLAYDHGPGTGQAILKSTNSRVNGKAFQLDFAGTIQDHQVHWKNNTFVLGRNRVTTSGTYGPVFTELSWIVDAKELADISDEMAGNLQSTGQYKFDGQNWTIDLSVNGEQLATPNLHANKLLFVVKGTREKHDADLVLSAYGMNLHSIGEMGFNEQNVYHANIKVDPLAMVRGRKKQHTLFELGGADVQITIDKNQLSSTGEIALIKPDNLSWSLNVDDWNDLSLATLNATIKGMVTQWDPLRLLITDTNDFSAKLKIDLQAEGKVLEPTYKGALTLSEARLALPGQGITLQDGNLTISPSRNHQELLLDGSIRSGEGVTGISGTLSLKDRWPSLDVWLKGDRFTASNTSQALVYVSPQLHIQTQERTINLSGELHIPEATLNIKGYQSYVAPSPDIVVLLENGEMAMPFYHLNTRVLLSLGDKISLKTGHLNTGIGGQIHLVQLGDAPVRASGQLHAVDGKYAAYGKKLNLSQAILTFNNSPIDNPALFIEASRKVQVAQTQNASYIFADPGPQNKSSTVHEGTVGIRITGTVQIPKYTFYSTPPMSEADQLSYLLTGAPSSQIGSAQAAFMFAALTETSGMLGVSDTDAARLENITRRMGIDFNIEAANRIDASTGQTITDTNLVVGKAIRPRLYVSYTVGLLDPLNMFRVRYQLSRRWALQSQTNTQGDTGGDVLYGIETDHFLGMD